MAEVEAYEFAVQVDGQSLEWFKSFHSEGTARQDAIDHAEQLIERGEQAPVSIELTITYCEDTEIVWRDGAAVDDED